MKTHSTGSTDFTSADHVVKINDNHCTLYYYIYYNENVMGTGTATKTFSFSPCTLSTQ